jgi:hypothetical protein
VESDECDENDESRYSTQDSRMAYDCLVQQKNIVIDVVMKFVGC